MVTVISKPQADEYPAYAAMYFQLVAEDMPLAQTLQNNAQDTINLIRGLPEDKLMVPCAPGEWTVKEIFGHIMDQERVLVYRAMRFARGDESVLATFDHDAYVKNAGANQRPLDEMVDEFLSIRRSSITFFNSLDERAVARSGWVGGNRFSVRALAWLTTGHEQHHLNSLKQNYF